jgi:hypothetical protein
MGPIVPNSCGRKSQYGPHIQWADQYGLSDGYLNPEKHCSENAPSQGILIWRRALTAAWPSRFPVVPSGLTSK